MNNMKTKLTKKFHVGDKVRIVGNNLYYTGKIATVIKALPVACRLRIDGEKQESGPYWYDELELLKHIDTLAILKKVIK